MSYWPADDELGESYILRYLALTADKRIGALWLGHGGVCWISPAAASHPWNAREVSTIVKLRILIDELDPQLNEAAPQGPPKIGPRLDRFSRLLVRKRA